MGFFDKVKQALNIGGVNVKMQVGPDISRNSGKADGTLTVTTKSPQHVKSVRVVFERTISTPKQNQTPGSTQLEMDTRSDELGRFESKEEFDIKPGETKTINFAIPFNLPQGAADQLAQIGGILGAALGGLNNGMMNQSRMAYRISANLDVDKAAFDASDSKEVRVV